MSISRLKLLACAGALSALGAAPASAFCGFYVAKADANLFNSASKVAIMRDGDRNVVTMANDFQGDPTEFAMVIPTPVVLKESQIHIGDLADLDHLDAYTAPRLAEYFDPDPCQQIMYETAMMRSMAAPAPVGAMMDKAADLGVTIEAQYTIGEYDILILSAKESDGLQQWLDQEGYKVPEKARKVLGSYIAQGMKFFVAKVNLEEKAKLGGEFLRPIQIAYEDDRFMLPIRLGTVNAQGKQDLIIYALTREGRVETTNYRTARIPTDMDLPTYLKNKDEFGEFYKAMFAKIAERDESAVFLEYAWDMGWCDPCAADPLSQAQLKRLGVYWIDPQYSARPQPAGKRIAPMPPMPGGGPVDVYVTRLHVRYDADTFPEDLKFQTTGDRDNFQGRYVMRHPFTGELSCPAGRDYAATLAPRFEAEAAELANLTGWDIAGIREKQKANGQVPPKLEPVVEKPWWETIWGK